QPIRKRTVALLSLMDMPLMWTAWIPSGFPLSRSYGQVFAIYMTKSKIIPGKGGNKYDWNEKITLHLDLDEIAQLGLFLTGQTCDETHVIFHQLNHQSKTLSIKKGGKGDLSIRASYQNQEVVLTLSSGDSFLMSKGLENLLGVLLWKTS
ncbi:MAG: hypothetical protein ACHQYP_09115, partial [Nitrospiria bacterium]